MRNNLEETVFGGGASTGNKEIEAWQIPEFPPTFQPEHLPEQQVFGIGKILLQQLVSGQSVGGFGEQTPARLQARMTQGLPAKGERPGLCGPGVVREKDILTRAVHPFVHGKSRKPITAKVER